MSSKTDDDGLVKVITSGNAHASIWKNEGGKHGHYFTCSFTRSYKDAEEETHYTTSFGAYDLAHVFSVGGQALTFMLAEARKLRPKPKTRSNTSRSRRRNSGNSSRRPTPPPPE